MILYIKNMVCNRCIKVVKEELEKLHLRVTDSKLINSFAVGASRFLYKGKDVWIDLGAIGTFYIVDKALHTYYGNSLYSGNIFIRLIPSRMKM